MPVRWLDEVDADDVQVAGGKGASLGELTGAGLQVPPAFIVTAGTFRTFLEETGIDEELYEIVDTEADDVDALSDVSKRARDLITGTPFPDTVRSDIEAAYQDLAETVGTDEPFVAVRSSATMEDLPSDSFAGQQETYLNVTDEAVVDRIQHCWASLFTSRAIYYRQTRGFDHREVDIAVVVQHMIDAEKSGVMFTRDPSTGARETTIEAAWGLGEGVVSGSVSPDTYVLDESGGIVETRVATKKTMYQKDEETGETVQRQVPADQRNERVLEDGELTRLHELGQRVEAHYENPQDVEWAIADGEIYLLQSRPITTIDAESARDTDQRIVTDGDAEGPLEQATRSEDTAAEGELLSGLAASPGRETGPARIVTTLDELDKVSDGDILVTPMTTPDMVPAMQRAVGIVTDEGGLTSHAAIVSRELGLPAVTGTSDATERLEDGQPIAIDGDRGVVEVAQEPESPESAPAADQPPAPEPDSGRDVMPPMTATEVKVNVSMPQAADRAAATGADGVGLLRIEHMILETGKTPGQYIADHGEEAYVDQLVDGIRTVADAFYPRPVRVRTLDAPTDEFRHLEGGETEPKEANPMLGYRGIRRSFDEPGIFVHELRAFDRLHDMGYDNVEIMFPLINDSGDVERCVELMEEAGIDTDRRSWGVMIETPASALVVEDLVTTGLDFVSFGTNDLTQYVLAVDRNNERVADRYDAQHPAVTRLISEVIDVALDHDVSTSICGEAGSNPEMVRFLVEAGVTSISANIDAVREVQRLAKRVEQRLVLDALR